MFNTILKGKLKSQKIDKLGFSVPAIMDKNYLKFLESMNKKYSHKIKRVYGSLPASAYGKSGFEHGRSIPFDKSGNVLPLKTLHDMKSYIHDVQRMGLDFVYLMNSVASVSAFDFQIKAPQIDQFLSELEDVGVKFVTVGNQMLADFIRETHPQISVGVSTMMHVDSLTKAEGLIKQLGIQYIVPSTDLNKNIPFITSFVELFPNNELELMADEGCIFGCSTKNVHYSLFGTSDKANLCSGIFKIFPINVCDGITREYPELQIIKNKIIYPWELPTYERLGIRLIKLVGRDHEPAMLKSKIEYYMRGIEDKDYALDAFYSIYNSRFVMREDFFYGKIKMKEIFDFLVPLDYFIETKTDCRLVCGVHCKKCYIHAEKMKKHFRELN